MNQTAKYLDGFRDWWIAQGHTTRSANSYCSAIRRVNDEFFTPATHKSMFDVLDDAVASGSAVNWLTALVGIITHRISSTANVIDKKPMQDCRCKLVRFIEYITELQEAYAASGVDDNTIDMSMLPEDKQFYDRKAIVKNFAFRIRTQDRISDTMSIFYPIRIIGHLFHETTRSEVQALFIKAGIVAHDGKPIGLYQWFKKWVRYRVNNVIFHTAKGSYKLSEIDGLLIDSHRQKAWIRLKGKDIALLSGGPHGMHEMKASSLSDIRLAQTEKMANVLQRLKPILIVMQLLTDDIRNAVRGQILTVTGTLNESQCNEAESISASVEIPLDKFGPDTLRFISRWYCENINWNRVACWMPLIRQELTYITAATRIIVVAREHQNSNQIFQ